MSWQPGWPIFARIICLLFHRWHWTYIDDAEGKRSKCNKCQRWYVKTTR